MSAFGYRKPADLPQTIALFPLTNALLFPRAVLSLNVFEPRYLNMVDDALAADRLIGMIQPGAGEENNPTPELSEVGCVGRITMFSETEDGRYLITLTGICRFEAGEELTVRMPYRQLRARYDRFEGDLADDEAQEAPPPARDRFAKALKRYLNHRELDIDWETASGAPLEALVNSLAMGLPFEPAEKQALLEAPDLAGRFEALSTLLEIDALEDGDDEGHSVQ